MKSLQQPAKKSLILFFMILISVSCGSSQDPEFVIPTSTKVNISSNIEPTQLPSPSLPTPTDSPEPSKILEDQTSILVISDFVLLANWPSDSGINVFAPQVDITEEISNTLANQYQILSLNEELTLNDNDVIKLEIDSNSKSPPHAELKTKGNLTLELTLLSDTDLQISKQVDGFPTMSDIAIHFLLRQGGFLGKLDPTSSAMLIRTPNAVVVITGTTFFIAYDEEKEITWIANFDGEVRFIDLEIVENADLLSNPEALLNSLELLPLGRLRAVQSTRDWPIDKSLNSDDLFTLIFESESSVFSADVISGPYLVANNTSEGGSVVNVRSSPSINLNNRTMNLIGNIINGRYAKILGISEDKNWYQIECPLAGRNFSYMNYTHANECPQNDDGQNVGWISQTAVIPYNADIDELPTIRFSETDKLFEQKEPTQASNATLECYYAGQDSYWFSNNTKEVLANQSICPKVIPDLDYPKSPTVISAASCGSTPVTLSWQHIPSPVLIAFDDGARKGPIPISWYEIDIENFRNKYIGSDWERIESMPQSVVGNSYTAELDCIEGEEYRWRVRPVIDVDPNFFRFTDWEYFRLEYN